MAVPASGLRRIGQELARYPVPWLAALLVLVSGALVAVGLLALRTQQLATSQRTLEAFTRVIEEMTARSLQTTHLHLELAAHEIERHEAGLGRTDLRSLLEKHLGQMPYANAMWFLDPQGIVVAGTTADGAGTDSSGRDYFQALRHGPRNALAIGRPGVGAVARNWRLPVAHTVHDARGRFMGVIVAGVDPAYFSQTWSSVELGPDYEVALFRRDRTLMLRSPQAGAELGRTYPELAMFQPPLQGLQQGRFETSSALDGVHRHYAFRGLQAWPELLLVVGQSRNTFMGPWWRTAGFVSLIWAAAALAVSGLSLFLHRSRARHAAAERDALALGARLDMATTAASIGAWEWDVLTDQAYGTPSYYTMLGYPPRDGVIDRQFWFDRCHPDDIAQAQTHIHAALTGLNDNYEYETRLRNASDEYRWTRLVGRVTERDPDGRPVRMLGVRMDIHRQKLAEEALRKSESLSLAVLNSMQARIAVLDHAGTVVAVNEPGRLAGSAPSPLAVTVGDGYPTVCLRLGEQALDGSLASRVADGILAVLERRVPSFTTPCAWRLEGAKRWLALQVTPLENADGGAVIAHTDITERVAAEDTLRQLMRLVALRTAINRAIIGQRDRTSLLQEICRVAIADGQFCLAWIGQADPATGRILPVAVAGRDNGFLARLTDPADGRIDAAALPLPRDPSDVSTIPDIASHAQDWPVWASEALRHGLRCAAVIGFSGGDHDAGLQLLSQEPGFFPTQEHQVLRDIGRDIAIAVAALGSEAARERAELALHALLRDKEALLKEVHHRVKNNLQVVSSLLRLEAARDVAPSTVHVLRDMQGRIQAMALLHESLYGSGNFAAVDLAVYLRQLGTQAFATFSTRSGAVGLQLELVPVDVSMDQAITCGLLVNELVSNSLKHAFPDGRTGFVRIALQAVGDHMRLEIADDGVGLPTDLTQRQASSLGLQLASDLAGQLGGSLERGGGPGTVFRVDFEVDTAH